MLFFSAEACKLLSTVAVSLPDFQCEPDYKLVKLIREQEVNHKQFSQIQALSEGVRSMFENEELRPIARLLLDPTELATGLMGFDEKRVVSVHGTFVKFVFVFPVLRVLGY
jgi:hypothetical protein